MPLDALFNTSFETSYGSRAVLMPNRPRLARKAATGICVFRLITPNQTGNCAFTLLGIGGTGTGVLRASGDLHTLRAQGRQTKRNKRKCESTKQ
jgi:hypothetical protein